MDRLPLAVLEHVLLQDPLTVADLARAVMACRCLHECLPGVANEHADQLGVRLPRSRISLTRWLSRATLEVAQMRYITRELEGAAHPPADLERRKLISKIQRMHPTVIEAQLSALVRLMDSPVLDVVLDFLTESTTYEHSIQSIRPESLAPFAAPCVRLVEDAWRWGSESRQESSHSAHDSATKALKVLVRVPADSIVPFASKLAACLGRYELMPYEGVLCSRKDVERIMIILSNLPADVLAPHAACIASWLSQPAAPWEAQSPVIAPTLKALKRLPPVSLVAHLPLLEQPHGPPSKLRLVNKVRRAAGLPVLRAA